MLQLVDFLLFSVLNRQIRQLVSVAVAIAVVVVVVVVIVVLHVFLRHHHAFFDSRRLQLTSESTGFLVCCCCCCWYWRHSNANGCSLLLGYSVKHALRPCRSRSRSRSRSRVNQLAEMRQLSVDQSVNQRAGRPVSQSSDVS